MNVRANGGVGGVFNLKEKEGGTDDGMDEKHRRY
jgi:hypothetical protein